MTVWPNGTKTKPYVSSAFGPRNINVPNASKNHKGADFSHTFRRVRAVAAGRVVFVGTPRGWTGGGTQVWIQHDGFFSKSLHLVLGSPVVRVGDVVVEGQDLGEMGRTGTASDVHLHLEITPGNVHYSNTGQVDPVKFLADRIGGTPASSGGASTPIEGFLMALSDYDQQLVKNAVVDINNRTADMAAAMAKSDAQVAALHAIYAQRDSNGWAWADIVKSHVVATLTELRAAGVTSGSVDIDALTKRIVDEQAKRLAS